MRQARSVSVRLARGAALTLAMLALAAGIVSAQKKESKEAADFRNQIEKIRTSIVKTKEQLQATVASYNTVVEEKNKKLDAAHKKLVSDIDKSEKMVDSLRKEKDPTNKKGEAFFAAWDKDLQGMSSGTLREASQQRLDAARQAFQGLQDGLKNAGEVYTPFITSLKEQATLMGRDLTPETMAVLRGKAAPELNTMAEDLFKKIDAILNRDQANEQKVKQAMDEEADAEEETSMDPEEEE